MYGIMVNKEFQFVVLLLGSVGSTYTLPYALEVQQNIYVQCGGHICSGMYSNNVKCMYTGAPGHIIDYTYLSVSLSLCLSVCMFIYNVIMLH